MNQPAICGRNDSKENRCFSRFSQQRLSPAPDWFFFMERGNFLLTFRLLQRVNLLFADRLPTRYRQTHNEEKDGRASQPQLGYMEMLLLKLRENASLSYETRIILRIKRTRLTITSCLSLLRFAVYSYCSVGSTFNFGSSILIGQSILIIIIIVNCFHVFVYD